MANPVIFTSKGTKVDVTKRGKTANVGYFDPATGTVYRRPNIRADQGLGAGGQVKVTNPKATDERLTASLGMGGVLQRGRSRDKA